MPKDNKERDPSDLFVDLIRETAQGLSWGIDTFFDDVAKGAEKIMGPENKANNSKDTDGKKD